MWDEVNPNLWITNENTQISQDISIENATFTWAGKINIFWERRRRRKFNWWWEEI